MSDVPPPPPPSVPPPPPPATNAAVPLTAAPSGGSGTNRGLLVAIVAVVVAVLGVGAFLVLRSDDEGSVSEPTESMESTDDVDETAEPSTDIPPATESPEGLGDDGVFDDLAQQCFDASMESCDQLYRQAELDSEYERYGDTCAGRQDEGSQQYCVDVFPTD